MRWQNDTIWYHRSGVYVHMYSFADHACNFLITLNKHPLYVVTNKFFENDKGVLWLSIIISMFTKDPVEDLQNKSIPLILLVCVLYAICLLLFVAMLQIIHILINFFDNILTLVFDFFDINHVWNLSIAKIHPYSQVFIASAEPEKHEMIN